MTRQISIAKLWRAAGSRKPGYAEAVLDAATAASPTHVTVSDDDYERLRVQYGLGEGVSTSAAATYSEAVPIVGPSSTTQQGHGMSNTVRLPHELVVAAAVSQPPEFLRDLMEASQQTTDASGATKFFEISTANYRRLREKYGDVLEPKSFGVPSAPPEPAVPHGPGTHLKGLLALIGITASPNCSCNARAKQMDEWGPDECEKRMPEIVTWLGEEAKRRGLPFVRLAGEQIVKMAIRRARKAAASAG